MIPDPAIKVAAAAAMPQIVDYPAARARLLAAGFVDLYHNAGAFGFPRGTDTKMLGWIGPPDGSIRHELRAFTKHVPEPHAVNLAKMFVQVRRRHLPGEAWLLPKSHWHFELHDGHPRLLESLLPEIAIDPQTLRDRNDGSAIAFSAGEDEALRYTVERLLEGMRFSDFLVAFPDAPTRALCTVHHHQQLWWQTTSEELVAALRGQSTQSSSS